MGTINTVTLHGDVGIGTTTPNARLHVKQRSASTYAVLVESPNVASKFLIRYDGVGTIRFEHEGGAGQYMHNVTGLWHQISDQSLKENIVPLEGVLDRVARLHPVRFDWRSNGSRSFGFVAQEVEPHFPELVSSMMQDGEPVKGVAYSMFGVVAVAAIQEMKSHYDARIEALERKLAELSARLGVP